MKPRLPSRNFTRQDHEVISHLCRRWLNRHGYGAATKWLLIAKLGDERDADLMLALMECQDACRSASVPMAAAHRMERTRQLNL
jgi:hypothetical protein